MSELEVDGEPIFDLTRSVPELAAVRNHLEARQWWYAWQVLEEIRGRGEDQLAAASEAISHVPDIEVCLDEMLLAHPGNAEARTLRAHRMLNLARAIRIGVVAADEGEDEHVVFEGMSRAVEVELIELCAQNPRMASPWFLRGITAVGLGINHSEARRRYDRLTANHPHHFSAQQQMLIKLAPRADGSPEALFGFAHQCADAAPAAAASNAAVAAAHFEMTISMSPTQRRLYLADQLVQDDLIRASAATVHDPGFVADLHSVSLHSLFAILWSFAGAPAEAATHYSALGLRASPTWFGRFRDPTAVFKAQRSAVLMAADSR